MNTYGPVVNENTEATATLPARSFTPVPTFTVYNVLAAVVVPLNTTLFPEQLVRVHVALGVIVTVVVVTVEQFIFSLKFIVTVVVGCATPVAPLAGIVELTVGEVVSGGGGITGAVTPTSTVPDFSPTLAVMVAVVSEVTSGAVNVTSSVKPSVVWLNGSIPPLFAVKVTVVPSGAGVPAVVVTKAVILDVPPESTVNGLA